MSDEARQMRVKAMTWLEEAKSICDHSNHRHDYDSDGPGYTCNDCGDYGYGPCAFCEPSMRDTQAAAGGAQ